MYISRTISLLSFGLVEASTWFAFNLLSREEMIRFTCANLRVFLAFPIATGLDQIGCIGVVAVRRVVVVQIFKSINSNFKSKSRRKTAPRKKNLPLIYGKSFSRHHVSSACLYKIKPP
jgi:hypothetical protein